MKYTFAVIVFGALSVALLNASSSLRYDSSSCSSYPCLVFEDQFDWLDFDTWEHEITAGGGGNGEFQYYLNNRSNSYVKGGKLHLKPTLAEERYGKDWPYFGSLSLWGSTPPDLCTGNRWNGCEKEASGSQIVNPIQSARIRSTRSFSFRYGRLEVEAKLPRGDWLWPAIWLLPKHEKYGVWPTSGEIDLMEARGNADLLDSNGNQIGISTMGFAVHFGPSTTENGYPTALSSKTLTNGRTFADDFHRFRFDWDENGMKFFVDDEEIMKVDTGEGYWKRGGWDERFGPETNPWTMGQHDAPFDQEFYLIMNVAVGGTGGYFGEWINHPPYPKPWDDSSDIAMRQFWEARTFWLPTWANDDDRAMQINYVKMWKLKEDCWLTKPPTCTRW